jgi:DNA polymerase I-like protein with 3'-5' exonuclease and polymerase domains
VGRVRHLPKVKAIYEHFGDTLQDWRIRKQLAQEIGREESDALYRDYRNGLNQVLNYQIQSYSASIVNRAALRINRWLKQENLDGQVIAQIHDQLVCEIREDHVERACEIIQICMEQTTTLDGVQLIAEPAVAKNMRDGH